eukprot:6177995-Pleurochrysis_carterae.AAC.1
MVWVSEAVEKQERSQEEGSVGGEGSRPRPSSREGGTKGRSRGGKRNWEGREYCTRSRYNGLSEGRSQQSACLLAAENACVSRACRRSHPKASLAIGGTSAISPPKAKPEKQPGAPLFRVRSSGQLARPSTREARGCEQQMWPSMQVQTRYPQIPT